MKRYEGPNRRRVFRLRLPESAMLKVRLNDQLLDVIEVAEFSIVVTTDVVTTDVVSTNVVSTNAVSTNVVSTNAGVAASDEGKNEPGICAGIIRWSDGTTSSITGEVGRLGHLGRVICNITGIEMKDVIGEQRRMLLRYPAFSSLRKIS